MLDELQRAAPAALLLIVAVITHVAGPWIQKRQEAASKRLETDTVREGYAWDSLRAEVEGLRGDLRDLRATVTAQRQEIDLLESERDQLRDQLGEARASLSIAQVEVARLRARVDHLEQQRG